MRQCIPQHAYFKPPSPKSEAPKVDQHSCVAQMLCVSEWRVKTGAPKYAHVLTIAQTRTHLHAVFDFTASFASVA